jgi:preprotein translocase subunit SecF
MFSFAQFGNDLYTGRRSYDFVGKRKLWYALGASMILISLIALFAPAFGINAGIEFRGGSEFKITNVTDTGELRAKDVVTGVVPGTEARVSKIGSSTLRIQTDKLTAAETTKVANALTTEYGVPSSDVSSSFVGPSWGQDVSRKAIQALAVFLLLVTAVIAIYFRTWKMALAAIVALAHDLIITVGVYCLIGFEVTPATVIGFLTILGYSLYDTVVVFDKVRENTEHVSGSTKRTFGEAANLAINQTLVRSINTSVVALLPVGSILFIGAFLMGAGTLLDLSLALFVGIAVGTFSSIFIATPLYVQLRENEPQFKAQAERVMKRRAAEVAAAAAASSEPRSDADAGADDVAEPVGVGAAPSTSAASTSGSLAPAKGGQRAQPKSNQRGRGPKGRR